MPRCSRKASHIQALWEILEKRISNKKLRVLSRRTNHVEDRLDLLLLRHIKALESKRYIYRGQYRKADQWIFEQDMAAIAEGEVQPWLNDDEFLYKYRMSRESFHKLVGLIKHHPGFQTRGDRLQQYPVEYQLMVFLYHVGTFGCTNPNTRNVFRIGRGTANVFRKRVVQAILSLKQEFLKWPDEDERRIIASRFLSNHRFPNCVGIVDGTLFPLAFEPQTDDAPDYHGRKYRYSLSVPIVCDDQRLIRYAVIGWPGSAHDNRIFNNSRMGKRPELYFTFVEYLLGDSAYECSNHMVAAYRSFKNQVMDHNHERFNSAMGSPRVISEHTIGILKGRFPWLQSIRNKITEDPRSKRRVISMIECCIILHNYLMMETIAEREEEVPEDFEFWEDEDARSTIDAQPPEDDDELNAAIPAWAASDARRTQLLHYIILNDYA